MRLLTGSRWRIGPAISRRSVGGPGCPPGRRRPTADRASRPGRAPTRGQAPRVGHAPTSAASRSRPRTTSTTRASVDALDALPPTAGSPRPDGGGSPGWPTSSAPCAGGPRNPSSTSSPTSSAPSASTSRSAARTGDVALSRADLDAFLDVAVGFAESGEGASLSAFLAYLDAADAEERGLEPGQVEVAGGTRPGADGARRQGAGVGRRFRAGSGRESVPRRPEPRTRRGSPTSGHCRSRCVATPTHCPRWTSNPRPTNARSRRRSTGSSRSAATGPGSRSAGSPTSRRPGRVSCWSGRGTAGTRRSARASRAVLLEVAEACRAGAGRLAGWHGEVDLAAGNPVTAAPPRHAWPYDPLTVERRHDIEGRAELVAKAHAALGSGSR